MLHDMNRAVKRWTSRARRGLSALFEEEYWTHRVVLISLFLSLLLTWPAVLHVNSEVLGSPDADGGKHFWTLWWMKHSLVGLFEFPHETSLVNYPEGMTLYPIEPLNGLGVSILFFLPLIAATNIIALVNLTLTGVISAFLGRELTGSPRAGIVCGILLQSSAYSMFTIHAGVGELQHLWWLPLCFLMWHRLRNRMRWQDSVLLGLSLAGASLSCFYYGLFAGLGVLILSLTTLWAGAKTPKLLLHYAAAALLGLMIVLPISSNFASSFGEGEPPRVGLSAYIQGEGNPPVTDFEEARLELNHLIAAPYRGKSNVSVSTQALSTHTAPSGLSTEEAGLEKAILGCYEYALRDADTPARSAFLLRTQVSGSNGQLTLRAPERFQSTNKLMELPECVEKALKTQNLGQRLAAGSKEIGFELNVHFQPQMSQEVLAYGGGRYLGIPAMLLLVLAVFLRPKKTLPWMAVGFVGIIFALGSYWVSNGVEATNASGGRYQLPFLFMNRALGYLVEPVNFPVRFLALTATAIAVCGAWASVSSIRGKKLMDVAVVLALLNALSVQWGQVIPRPMPRFTPTTYTALRDLPDNFGPLLDLTQALHSDQETRVASQNAQIIHQQSVQSVPIERIEKFADSGQVWVRSLSLVQWMEGVRNPVGEGVQKPSDERLKNDLVLLYEQGFRGILLLGPGTKRGYHPDVFNAISSMLSKPAVADGRSAVWAIPPHALNPDEVIRLQEAHDRKIHVDREPASKGQAPNANGLPGGVAPVGHKQNELNRPLR